MAEWLYHRTTASGYAVVFHVETLNRKQLDLGLGRLTPQSTRSGVRVTRHRNGLTIRRTNRREGRRDKDHKWIGTHTRPHRSKGNRHRKYYPHPGFTGDQSGSSASSNEAVV